MTVTTTTTTIKQVSTVKTQKKIVEPESKLVC